MKKNIIVIQKRIMEIKGMKLIAKIVLCCSWLSLNAQSQLTIIKGGTVHIGNGRIINNGNVFFQNGIIIGVDSLELVDNKSAKVIDAKGKQIYPGLFCMNTYMGLNEIDAVRATRDYNETGPTNSDARTLIAFNTDSKVLPTALFNGILFAQIIPTGGVISGQSSIMKTKGWNWEDAQVQADEGLHLWWPELSRWGDITKQQERLLNELQQIEEFFYQSVQYNNQLNPASINLRLESMKNVLNGKIKLYIHVSSEDGIIQSIRFAKKFKEIKPVLVGAESAYRVLPFIKENNIPVVVNLTHRLPQYAHEDIDLPYRLPSLLTKAGIMVAIGSSGSWESRNVAFQAGTAAAYGLSKEEALQCITYNAAIISGTADRTGTIEKGKSASILISKGDILDMKSNDLEYVFLEGQEIIIEGEQQKLFKKFSEKYGWK